MKRILIFLEKDHLQDCLSLSSMSALLSLENEEIKTYGVGFNLSELEEKSSIDYLINVNIAVDTMNTDLVAQVLKTLNDQYAFDYIIVCATWYGRMIAPRLAAKLNTGLVADVTDILLDDEGMKMIRPTNGGMLLAEILCKTTPIMMSVRPDAFSLLPFLKKSPIILPFDWLPSETPRIRLVSEKEKLKKNDISKSKTLVSCGGGMGSDLTKANQLAIALNGLLAVSRRPVDCGIASRNIQVGQSGKFVKPELYIALGISGSMQHIEGIKGSKSIISVNTDEFAPINFLSDFVIVGDVHLFLEKLLERISHVNEKKTIKLSQKTKC